MLLTGTDPPQPTALSWPCLNVGKYLKNIFKSVASISVKCVIMISCGDSASVGLSFYLFSFVYCFCFVTIYSELIIVSGVMTFLFFFNTADQKVFGIIGWP